MEILMLSHSLSLSCDRPVAPRRGAVLVYGLIVAGILGVYGLVGHAGAAYLATPLARVGATPAPSAQAQALLHVLLALAAILVAGRALAAVFTYLGQPAVIG